MRQLVKQVQLFFNKAKVKHFLMVGLKLALILPCFKILAQEQLIPNNNFESKTIVYHEQNSTSINNLQDWKAINTVDYYRKGLDTSDFIGITTLMPFEYIYCKLNRKLEAKKNYTFLIEVYGNIKNGSLDFMLFNDSLSLDEFKVRYLAGLSNNGAELYSINRIDNVNGIKRRKSKWQKYSVSFIPRSDLDYILIGNCNHKITNQEYIYIKSVSLVEKTKSKTLETIDD